MKPWINWVGPKSNDKCLYKRQGDIERVSVWRWRQRQVVQLQTEECPGLMVAIRSWERGVEHIFSRSLKGTNPVHACTPSCSSRVQLCDPMDCSPPGSSVHGILQARILEWVVISFSRVSSQPRDWTWVIHGEEVKNISCISCYCFH